MNDSTPLSLSGADDAHTPSDELSDSDLEQVVGGLARAWQTEPTMLAEPTPILFAVTPIVASDPRHRISA